MKIGIYPGTFDPPTNGHLYMMAEGSRLFDRLVVAVAVNPEKRAAFDVQQRVKLLKAIAQRFGNVEVATFHGEFTVDAADRLGARHVLRGIRNGFDADHEREMAVVNHDLNPSVSTVFLMVPRDLVGVSSSMVRGLVGHEGWEAAVARYLPLEVIAPFHALHSTPQSPSVLQRVERAIRLVGGTKDSPDLPLIYARVVQAYQANGRHYHDFRHVTEVVRASVVASGVVSGGEWLVEPMAFSEAEQGEITLALFYHDVAHDPRRSDNEALSADWAEADLRRLGVGEASIAAVRRMILATSHPDERPTDDREALVRDIDLGVLARDAALYDRYVREVRLEYGYLDDATWRAGRRDFVRRMSGRPLLFHSHYGFTKWESAARANLDREFAALA